MLEDKKFITYVSSKTPKEDAAAMCNKLCRELPIVFNRVDTIQDLFPLLSDPHSIIDRIVIDIDDLYNQSSVEWFDLVRTLNTLITCTVCRETLTTIPQKRKTKIIALIPDDISKSRLKEILAMPEISGLTFRIGGRVDYTIIKRCVENHISDSGERAPKFILDFIKEPKPQKPKAAEIPLTTRQRQIFDIITTRGASNKHIAKMLMISESTVKLHVGSIFKKYGVKNRTQLAVFSKRKQTQTEVLIQ